MQLDRERLKDLFSLALELPGAARPDFLRESCASDAPLRRELESLLAAYDEPRPLIERDDFAAASIFGARAGAGYEGKRFGRYRVVREIGRGGMGAVFLAERADGEFEQRVALKVVRRGFADPDLARRFRRERQILATLNHENVARLLNGGVSEDGEPFFVMEHVEGARVDDYCDANNLAADARLRLFLKVCDGVAYAHQRLVVHRDLKPSNVLVTPDGTPKLLDFGIAKLLDPEQAGDETRTEHRAFTPDYAAPEQVAGLPVTTSADVYSLGRLLRTILQTGGERRARRRAEDWRAGGADGRTAATNLPTRPEDGGAAETHHRLLGAELRNIVAMATREEAERRYPSVAALAEDVRRYLAGLPVRAQKDSFTYRAGKFVRRNRLPVAAAALVGLSLVVGASAVAWQARVAGERARVAAENQRRAEVEAARARKITAFAERVLSYANPAWYAEGHRQRGQARVIDVLNDLAAIIETEFPDDPEIQAELNHKCAEIFLANSMHEQAERHARRALDLRRRAHGERHAEVAKDLYYLGAVLGWYGGYAEGMRHMREASEMFREVAPDNANVPYLLEDFGSQLSSSYADLDEAERVLSESLELFRRREGDASHHAARLYLILAVNAARKKEFARADELLREGETRSAAQIPVRRALPLRFRGEIEMERGNYAAAEEGLKRYAAVVRSIEGENRGAEEVHVEMLLLRIYDQQKQWAKAVELARADAEAEKRVASATSPTYNYKLAVLALYLLRDGRGREGALYFEQARRGRGAGTPAYQAEERLRLGECLLLLGRRDEALAMLEEARTFMAANYPASYPQTADVEALVARARGGGKP